MSNRSIVLDNYLINNTIVFIFSRMEFSTVTLVKYQACTHLGCFKTHLLPAQHYILYISMWLQLLILLPRFPHKPGY